MRICANKKTGLCYRPKDSSENAVLPLKNARGMEPTKRCRGSRFGGEKISVIIISAIFVTDKCYKQPKKKDMMRNKDGIRNPGETDSGKTNY